MTAARRVATAVQPTVLHLMSILIVLMELLCCWASRRSSTAKEARHPPCLVRHLVMPTIFKTTRALPIIGKACKYSRQSSSDQLPTIADHRQGSRNGRQDRADDGLARSTDRRSPVERFNDRQRTDGTGIEAQPIVEPTIKVDGPTAATTFVRWAAEHGLADEWRVDHVWYIALEDFAPATDVQLPPRRVFLGALKKMPGVTCTPNRRVYDRNGNLRGKTTFYRLPTTPEMRTASEPAALRVVKHAA